MTSPLLIDAILSVKVLRAEGEGTPFRHGQSRMQSAHRQHAGVYVRFDHN